MGRFAEQFRQLAERKREDIPDQVMRLLENISQDCSTTVTDDATASTDRLYELSGDVLTLRWVYGRGSMVGEGVAQKCLPDVKELVKEANCVVGHCDDGRGLHHFFCARVKKTSIAPALHSE